MSLSIPRKALRIPVSCISYHDSNEYMYSAKRLSELKYGGFRGIPCF